MKRIILAAMFVSALGVGYSAHAACVTAGDFNRATVSFNDANGAVAIYAEMRGGALTGSTTACHDATTSNTPAHGRLTITVNGVVVCDNSSRLESDPFGFGSGVHQVDNRIDNRPVGVCGADVSWGEIGSVPSVATATNNGIDGEGVYTGLSRTTTVGGLYWLTSPTSTFTIPSGTSGTATRGHRVSAP